MRARCCSRTRAPSTRASQPRRPTSTPSATATPGRSASARTSRSARASSLRCWRLSAASGRRSTFGWSSRPTTASSSSSSSAVTSTQLLRLPARGRAVRVGRAHARPLRARRARRLAARRAATRRRRFARSSSCRSSATARAVRPSASRSACGWPAASRTSCSARTTTAPLQALVAAGVGVALVPRLTVDPVDESIAVIELGDRVPPRIIGVAWHADRQLTPAARMFIQAAEAVCRSKELAAA